jgi:colanic acid biosynthesis glycosyl transferase WcaI
MLAMASWRPDAVLTVEPAFTCAPVALVAGFLANARSWLHVQDFEVDAAFDLGLLPAGGMTQEIALKFEKFAMRCFSRVSTISPRMVERLVQKGIDASKAVLFPNWVDVDGIYPMCDESPMRAELGIGRDEIVVLYSGNMGAKQGLDILPELAGRLRHQKKLRFIFCGDGAYRRQLEPAVAGIENVSFLPLQPLDRLNELLNAADIHLLPQRAGAADLVMPSKLTGMLASGRAIIATATVGTQIAHAVEGCGVVVPPGDAKALADAVELLAGNRELRQRMGYAARVYAERELARDPVLERFEAMLEASAAEE